MRIMTKKGGEFVETHTGEKKTKFSIFQGDSSRSQELCEKGGIRGDPYREEEQIFNFFKAIYHEAKNYVRTGFVETHTGGKNKFSIFSRRFITKPRTTWKKGGVCGVSCTLPSGNVSRWDVGKGASWLQPKRTDCINSWFIRFWSVKSSP